jgi:hypothetical protein
VCSFGLHKKRKIRDWGRRGGFDYLVSNTFRIDTLDIYVMFCSCGNFNIQIKFVNKKMKNFLNKCLTNPLIYVIVYMLKVFGIARCDDEFLVKRN